MVVGGRGPEVGSVGWAATTEPGEWRFAMKRIHTPSILIGALLGLCVVLSMGGADDGPDARYQISAASSGGDRSWHDVVYIVDTETGQLWSRSNSGRKLTNYGTPTQPTAVSTNVP